MKHGICFSACSLVLMTLAACGGGESLQSDGVLQIADAAARAGGGLERTSSHAVSDRESAAPAEQDAARCGGEIHQGESRASEERDGRGGKDRDRSAGHKDPQKGPPTDMACAASADCAASEFCASTGGTCSAEGTCTQRPEVCLAIFDPVCGCDGSTYSNACSAASAGVSVQSDGECPRSAPFCGGIAGFSCPGSGECVDDPGDDCDPEQGGADCGGLCECSVLVDCEAGFLWDVSAEVCDCVPEPDPCALVRCMAGTECVVGEDGTASCEPTGGAPFCGGIAGFGCPGSGQCVDDPGDDCDPEQGGADCGGICECNVLALCVPGYTFDASPEVCACVLQDNPCAAVTCLVGNECVVVDGEVSCQPIEGGGDRGGKHGRRHDRQSRGSRDSRSKSR
jgi:hypothetical protein